MKKRRSVFPDPGETQLLSGKLFLLFGAALLIRPFWVFGWLVQLFPWLLTVSGALCAAGALTRKPFGKIQMVAGAVGIGLGVWLFRAPVWRDRVLWYVLAALLLWSGAVMLSGAFRPAVARQTFARVLGGGTAAVFALLMFFKPRSGLSDALTLIGLFTLAWGVYLAALPRRQEQRAGKS